MLASNIRPTSGLLTNECGMAQDESLKRVQKKAAELKKKQEVFSQEESKLKKLMPGPPPAPEAKAAKKDAPAPAKKDAKEAKQAAEPAAPAPAK